MLGCTLDTMWFGKYGTFFAMYAMGRQSGNIVWHKNLKKMVRGLIIWQCNDDNTRHFCHYECLPEWDHRVQRKLCHILQQEASPTQLVSTLCFHCLSTHSFPHSLEGMTFQQWIAVEKERKLRSSQFTLAIPLNHSGDAHLLYECVTDSQHALIS